jgi:hypothetical protein
MSIPQEELRGLRHQKVRHRLMASVLFRFFLRNAAIDSVSRDCGLQRIEQRSDGAENKDKKLQRAKCANKL